MIVSANVRSKISASPRLACSIVNKASLVRKGGGGGGV